jgi:hypothetical protein
VKRAVFIGIAFLLLLQFGGWATIGRARLPHVLSEDILELTQGNFFLDPRSLEEAPPGARPILRERLLAHPDVFLESELPADNRTEAYRTGSGKIAYNYKVPKFGLTSWSSTPVGAKVECIVYLAPLGARGLQVRYFWALGFWVRRESRNPTWIS